MAALFQACLGGICLAVFLSLSLQLVTLIGERGLVPVGEHLERVPEPGWGSYWSFPTLFWVAHSDTFIRAVTWSGMLLAVLLMAGVASRWVTFGLWALFLSCIVAGRDFFWYQWDSLLLETLFLAVFLPGRGSLQGLVRSGVAREPPAAVVFLYRWLLFRLLFESGLAKAFSGDENWWNLTAMSYYYETAPHPSLGGWWIQQAPMVFHQLSVIFTFLIELPLALLAFAPRPLRLVLFGTNAAFQATIFLTANYGYFNVLAFVIGFFLLEDRDLRWFVGVVKRVPIPWRLAERSPASWLGRGWEKVRALVPSTGRGRSRGAREQTARQERRLRRRLVNAAWGALVTFVVAASLLEAAHYIVPRKLPRLAGALSTLEPFRFYSPLRLVSKYHLFPGILRERRVVRILGSVNGRDWRPYSLRHTPGEPERPPPVTGLHNPRFAFHYSFLPMNRRRDLEYFNALLERLCCDPQAVEDLLEEDPFAGNHPRGLRLDFYRYRFSSLEHRRRTGEYWLSEYLGSHGQIIPCRCERGITDP
jgi:hypothetical protein